MPPTPFESRVYAAVSLIPRGRVATYMAVARSIGCRSSRAVGQALRRNPQAPRVPCHRVIRSDLHIGGYQGNTAGAALLRKRALLEQEGVRFENGRLADPGRVISLPQTQPSA